jgi:lipid-A-disaccharide synthase
MIVLYRVSYLTSQLGPALVRVPCIGLVNLVLGRQVAPETAQDDVQPQCIRSAVGRLLGDRWSLFDMRRAREPLRRRLGEAGTKAVAAVLGGAV